MFEIPAQWISVIISAISFAAAIVAIMGVFSIALKERSRSKYDFDRQEARLSAMRDYYEQRLSQLAREMTSTEQRWREINHLVISGQTSQADPVDDKKVALTTFLRNLGINSDDLSIDPKLVLVLTPFSSEETEIYAYIKEVCTRTGFMCVRGDETFTDTDILTHVIRIMVRARLVIANITSRNPNVFYELGIAHALGKQTLLVSKTIHDAPFDVKTRRIITFEDEKELQSRLGEAMLMAISHPNQVEGE
jgi:hypothetical protein